MHEWQFAIIPYRGEKIEIVTEDRNQGGEIDEAGVYFIFR
jgi:hypothetical protein